MKVQVYIIILIRDLASIFMGQFVIAPEIIIVGSLVLLPGDVAESVLS